MLISVTKGFLEQAYFSESTRTHLYWRTVGVVYASSKPKGGEPEPLYPVVPSPLTCLALR